MVTSYLQLMQIHFAAKSVLLKKPLFTNIMYVTDGSKYDIFSYSELINKILPEGVLYRFQNKKICLFRIRRIVLLGGLSFHRREVSLHTEIYIKLREVFATKISCFFLESMVVFFRNICLDLSGLK